MSLPDAVASKVSAVYSRAEVRDYLDLDSIRESGRFTDAEILELAVDRDPGFDVQMFAGQLDQINRLGSARRVEEYGVGEQELAQLKSRLNGWAEELRNDAPTPGQRNVQKVQQQSTDLDPRMEQVMKLVHASYPGTARDALRPPAETLAAEARPQPKDRGQEQGREL